MVEDDYLGNVIKIDKHNNKLSELWDPVDYADWLGNLFVAAANAGYTVVKSAFPIISIVH